MNNTILEINNLTKNYILGNRKNARLAQKAIIVLQKKYERAVKRNDERKQQEIIEKIKEAQTLFAQERFEESYQAITAKSLKKRAKDRGVVVHALNGVDLKIEKGELVAIMGPSGSGKSTLLHMLGLLDELTAGQLFVNGKSVTAIKNSQLPEIRAHELGFVFQSFNLIPSLTALENVMLPLRYAGIKPARRKEMASEALAQVGLADRLLHTPNELSGGQQQRVAIARSIVNKPSIIFGDELTGELDSKMTEEVMDLIVKLNQKGQTFVIVTHNPDVAKRCKRIIHMKDGQILKDQRVK